MANEEHIKLQYPRAWAELEAYYASRPELERVLAFTNFANSPLEFQLGLYIIFFQENGLTLDVQSLEFKNIERSIEESFDTLEKTIGHYS